MASVERGNFFNPYEIHKKHFYLWNQLNNWREYGQLNYVIQRNIDGITPNILAKQSDQDPRQYQKIRDKSQHKEQNFLHSYATVST